MSSSLCADTRRPRLLDLFCCEGGAGTGYARAGFEVVGVDINPQPLYPFEFRQGDAIAGLERALWYLRNDRRGMDYDLGDFDAIHASPPCQFATVYGNNKAHVKDDHPNLIPATRELLMAIGLPYVIENVEGARDHLIEPVRICGTGLGIRVRRHRYFETNWPLDGVACDHGRWTDRPFPGSSNRPNGRTVMNVGEYRVPQAVPPPYTEHIGVQLFEFLRQPLPPRLRRPAR